MAPFLRRTPLVTTTIDLYGRDHASVAFEPAPGRWPGHESTDRLVVPLGIAALALARADESAMGPVQGRLHHAAGAICDPALATQVPSGLSLAVSGRAMGAPEGADTLRIAARLVKSGLGPIPSIGLSSYGSVSLADAAAAVLAMALVPAGMDVRLSAALSLEGLLGWYRIADPHLQAPQQAVAYALRHAVARLTEEGHPVPAELRTAVDEHRKISPMAGG